MELITSAVRLVNQLLLAVLLMLAPLLVANPSTVGHWLAQVDVAYDSIWSEYISDCDCAPALD